MTRFWLIFYYTPQSLTGEIETKDWLNTKTFTSVVNGQQIHARCCHWLATSAAFTAKVTAWLTAQASGDRRRW